MSFPPFSPPCTGILVEISNIILDSSFNALTATTVNTFKSIICCSATSQYQRGELTKSEYFQRLQTEFQLTSSVDEAFAQVESTYAINTSLLSFLKELKNSLGGLRVYAVANIGKEDFDSLLALPMEWNVFDHIFTSSEMGMRKPELRFFHHIFNCIGQTLEELIFVDWDVDNVVTALSLGMKGIKFDGVRETRRTLKAMLFDPIQRSKDFLYRRRKTFDSVSTNGVTIHENFAQLMILEATGDAGLVEIDTHEVTWNYFIGPPILTQADFPNDLDTTALALTILKQPDQVIHEAINRMLEFVNEDGLPLTYFSSFKNRIDPVVCVNVLGLFFQHGRGHELPSTLEWLRKVLVRRAYIYGTAFYPSPEEFLFFFARFLRLIRFSHPSLHDELAVLLVPRLKERFGISDRADLEALLAMQCEDGGWEMGVLYQYASKKLKIGNRGVSTALAMRAIKGVSKSLVV
ncbi:HAD-like protein [Hirsutella rhossiliensis]|uniref:HAD-like protein n=1 Tax=Hirsutella rhossiliensis TaxID=111463 RepID=A0A9P8N0U0_9HYPO|nr:HAD-like protein [Hirsutella rhossiliensis]KAH0964825.1 HAD-like protein [Hirsutella rhossiliensis]